MKITDRLIGDHKTFRKMLQDLDDLSNSPGEWDGGRLIRLTELFKDHLVIHAWFEDEFFYPAVLQGLNTSSIPSLTPSYMSLLENEHRTIDGRLAGMEKEVKTRPMVRTWPRTYALFSIGLRAHMKKEEEELFPWSEKLLGSERLEALSEEMERRRAAAPRVRRHLET